MFRYYKILLLSVFGLLIGRNVAAQSILKKDTIAYQIDAYDGKFIHVHEPETPLHYFIYKFKMAKNHKLMVKYADGHIPDFFRNTINVICKRESTPRNKVVAAINGDFFSYKNGELEGFQVSNGELVYAHIGKIKYGVNIDKKNRVFLDSVYFDGQLKTSKNTYAITGVNTLKFKDSMQSVVLFDSHINFDSIQPTNYNLVLLEKKGKRLKYRKIVSQLPSDLSSNQYILAINDPNSKTIISEIQSHTVKIDISLKSHKTNKKIKAIQHISGGVPLLINGEIPQSSKETYNTYRGKTHPRTVLGINQKDKTVVFIVVDGRSNISAGANYEKLSLLLAENGCTDALNLDGGGSSVLWLNGEIKNTPSDKTGTRPCLNYLLLSI